MASPILHTLPLVAQSFTVMFSVDQYLFLSRFTLQADAASAAAILPGYFKLFFTPGITAILLLHTLTMAAAASNLVLGHAKPSYHTSRPWYWAGLAFNIAHFAYVPFIAPVIKSILDNEVSQPLSHLHRWLQIHSVRSLTSDLGAFICYFVAMSRFKHFFGDVKLH